MDISLLKRGKFHRRHIHTGLIINNKTIRKYYLGKEYCQEIITISISQFQRPNSQSLKTIHEFLKQNHHP